MTHRRAAAGRRLPSVQALGIAPCLQPFAPEPAEMAACRVRMCFALILPLRSKRSFALLLPLRRDVLPFSPSLGIRAQEQRLVAEGERKASTPRRALGEHELFEHEKIPGPDNWSRCNMRAGIILSVVGSESNSVFCGVTRPIACPKTGCGERRLPGAEWRRPAAARRRSGSATAAASALTETGRAEPVPVPGRPSVSGVWPGRRPSARGVRRRGRCCRRGRNRWRNRRRSRLQLDGAGGLLAWPVDY